MTLSAPDFVADILVTDEQRRSVLLGEVKARSMPVPETAKHYIESKAREIGADFLLFADLQNIEIIRITDRKLVLFSTAFILRNYTTVPILEISTHLLLEGLIAAWLSDLASNWKFSSPMGADQLEIIGLVSRLRQSNVRREVLLS